MGLTMFAAFTFRLTCLEILTKENIVLYLFNTKL